MGAFQRHLPQGLLRWSKPPRGRPSPLRGVAWEARWSWERFWLEYEPIPASRSSLFSSESPSLSGVETIPLNTVYTSLPRSAPGTSQVPGDTDFRRRDVTFVSESLPGFEPPALWRPLPERRKTLPNSENRQPSPMVEGQDRRSSQPPRKENRTFAEGGPPRARGPPGTQQAGKGAAGPLLG